MRHRLWGTHAAHSTTNREFDPRKQGYPNTLLQHTTATHYCNILLQHTTATHCCNTLLQHTTATHCCNTLLQHTTATHCCNTLLQHTTATQVVSKARPKRVCSVLQGPKRALPCVALCCVVLQCVAVCCRVLQSVAVCCSVLQCVAVCCSAHRWCVKQGQRGRAVAYVRAAS